MTNPTPHGQVPAIQRYKIGYHSDEWGQRSSTPIGIPDASGPWVRYEDHITALKAAQPVVVTPQPGAAYAAQDFEHQRAIMEGERNASLDAYSRVVHLTSAESRLYESAFTSGWDRRDRLAFYGQAPAPQPPTAQAAQCVLEDAARYRYLRDVPMELWPAELLSAIRLQQNAKWDAAIDAARAAQEGEK